MATLTATIKAPHIQELLAYQYCDGSDVFTIRKSVELYLDLDLDVQAALVQLFEQEGGFIGITYQDIRQEIYSQADLDKKYHSMNLFA